MQSKATRALIAGLLATSAWAALSLGSGSAVAATTATGQFNVNITLTPKCEVFNGSGATGTITDLPLSYTSFQTSASTGSTNFQVRCTNTLAYGLSLDSASMTDGGTGLQYALALSNSSTPISTPTATLGSLVGNGNTGQTYYVHGTVAANQDGTTTAGTANKLRTLTITY